MTHITIEREALQTVLEALESCDQVYGSEGSYQYFSQAMVDKAITVAKQALAAQRQWVGLTVEDKLTVRRMPWETLGDLMDNTETKLKEKNND
jgi:hypothetical protein